MPTYRMIAKDGRIVWVHDQSLLILDDEGNAKFWQGVLVDITEHKRAQELERDLAWSARRRNGSACSTR